MSHITVFPVKIKRSCSTPVNLLQCPGVPWCTVWEPNIFTKSLLLTPFHSTPQFIQSYSQSCSVSDQIKAPKRTAKPDDIFTLRTILTGLFESGITITKSIARSSKNKFDNTEGLVVRCTSWGSLWLFCEGNIRRGRDAGRAPDGQRNCGGAVGLEDGGRDAYEVKSLGLHLGLRCSSFFHSDCQNSLPHPHSWADVSIYPSCLSLEAEGQQGTLFLASSSFLLSITPGWKGQGFLPPTRQGLSCHILTSS